jgi:hypothetical protein
MGLLGPAGPAGFRRRGRRRGLVVGAAVGASAAKASSNKAQPVQSPAPIDNQDPMAQLEELAKLKDQGVITEEEFTAKKKQLLGL